MTWKDQFIKQNWCYQRTPCNHIHPETKTTTPNPITHTPTLKPQKIHPVASWSSPSTPTSTTSRNQWSSFQGHEQGCLIKKTRPCAENLVVKVHKFAFAFAGGWRSIKEENDDVEEDRLEFLKKKRKKSRDNSTNHLIIHLKIQLHF